MTYIWINPVVSSMYNPTKLNEFLQKHGYTRIEASSHWLDIVKDKYKDLSTQTSDTIIDVRCPKITSLVQEYHPSHTTFPNIEPILIHCGREISQREDLRGVKKLITTPCKALADMGNALQLEETHFIPWNDFVQELDCAPPSSLLEQSPIPPGFFEGLGLSIHSLSEESEIRRYFEQYQPNKVQLIELLFCKNGCHNGDGIRMCNNHDAKEKTDKKII